MNLYDADDPAVRALANAGRTTVISFARSGDPTGDEDTLPVC